MSSKRIIFITWNNFNSRSKSISDALGAESVFIGKSKKSKNPLINILDYPSKILANIDVIKQKKPDVVIVSNTQLIIALCNFVLSYIYKFQIILDSHSSAFDHPFYKYPKFLSYFFARKALVSLVTNSSHGDLLESKMARVFILTDIPFSGIEKVVANYNITDKFNICFICTFSPDEPISEVLKAAQDLDDFHIYITGNNARMDSALMIPENVTITGFLSRNDYDSLIASVDAIMCLTTREDTMQRGGSEAISMKKPLITSNTRMLKNYFIKGSVFVDPSSDSIANGIINLRKDFKHLKDEMIAFNLERDGIFESKLSELTQIIEAES